MNGWTLTRRTGRIALLGVAGAIVACASNPPRQEVSIVEAVERAPQSAPGPASCAALNAAAVCEKSTRLEGGQHCRCVDARALTGAGVHRF